MQEDANLSRIEARCDQLIHSPYLQKETPPELKNLKAVLEKVTLLIKEDVPSMITEIRKLRSQNKKLEAELKELRGGM